MAPGAYQRTEFSSNANDARCEAGGEELATYADELRTHFRQSVSAEGGDTADPQEVADKIFECATTETPVHNPVGSDAQLIVAMMAREMREPVPTFCIGFAEKEFDETPYARIVAEQFGAHTRHARAR